MSDIFKIIIQDLQNEVHHFAQELALYDDNVIASKRNKQNRNIKQILGHMVDSASNNTHRIIHLQYQESPIKFPDYANLGNNDKWIAIQNFENEDWQQLVVLWKYIHLHLCHVITNVDETKLENVWISALGDKIKLKLMIEDFPRHFDLHKKQIQELRKA